MLKKVQQQNSVMDNRREKFCFVLFRASVLDVNIDSQAVQSKSGNRNWEENCSANGYRMHLQKLEQNLTCNDSAHVANKDKYDEEYTMNELYWKIDPLTPVPVPYLLKDSLVANSPRGFHA